MGDCLHNLDTNLNRNKISDRLHQEQMHVGEQVVRVQLGRGAATADPATASNAQPALWIYRRWSG